MCDPGQFDRAPDREFARPFMPTRANPTRAGAPRSVARSPAAGGSAAMPLRRRLPRPVTVLLTGVLAGLITAGVVVAVRPVGGAAPPAASVPVSDTAAPAAPAAPTAAPDPCAAAVTAMSTRNRLAQR